MRILNGSERFPAELPAPVVTIGAFDGVHLGHRALIDRARGEARRRGGTAVLFTFEPHPARLLAPELCPPLLTTREQQLSLLEEAGLDAVVIEPFTRELAALPPEAFATERLLTRMRAAALVTGHDFTFGRHREGTIETLRRLGAERGVEVIVVPAVFSGEALVSSTLIRNLIAAGQVERAATLLGRRYEIAGRVVAGRGIGAGLGAHTANLESANELVPGSGVYLTRTRVLQGAAAGEYPSVTSIGDNPTFADAPFAVETHLLDFSGELAGAPVAIRFLAFLRQQRRFPDAQTLAAQIAQDIAQARRRHREEA